MSTLPADHRVADAHAGDHAHHHEVGFIRKYVFSMDHKVIGIQFLFTSLLFLLVGGLLALAVRWQIAWPFDVSQPIPVIGTLGGSYVPGSEQTTISGDLYNVMFTMHATFMIFFVIIPMLVGAFGNFLIPLMIGARDMAFPLLNMLSFWLAFAAGVVMVAMFFIEMGPGVYNMTGGAGAGWTAYPPLSTSTYSMAPGQTLWIISLLLVGSSSLMGAVNYITTILNLRAPGMTLFRMPLTIWALFITSILILMSTPVITSALLMLLFDRHLGTNFFVISDSVRAGVTMSTLDSGQPLLYQHLFWFYSHPAVYIMILPAMGIVSDVLSTFARKPIFGYKPMVFAIAGIAFLGFIVWGHHMFASGMNPILGTTFMGSTMMIALPSAIKTFNWLGTLWGGQIRYTPAMLFAIGFVAMFVIGGLSGIFMANAPVDLYFHDTYFIVGHIHYVLFGGSLFGIFAGIYYWYPKMFGRNMNQGLGILHFWLTMIAFNVTFFAMHIVGIGGHPRRYAQILDYPSLEDLQPLNILMTIGALMLLGSQLPFVVNFLCSLGRWGNRVIVYPALITLLSVIPGVELWGRIFGGDWSPLVSILLLGLVVGLFVVVDVVLASALDSGRDDRDRDRVASWPVALAWVLSLPAFFYPIFGKGDFWEWTGWNSTTYVIDAEASLGAPMQPMPMAVDPERTETVEWVQRVEQGGEETLRVPAELPVVTAVNVNWGELALTAERQEIDLLEVPAIVEALETRTDYNFMVMELAAIEGLPADVRSLVENHVHQVPGTRAVVQRIELQPDHRVSRTWKSPKTGDLRIVDWTSRTLGIVLALATGLIGLGVLLARRTYLGLGERVGSNPWQANSLEWYATSPPWFENFPETPEVKRGPYEFASPAAPANRDYLTQWDELPEGVEEPSGH